MLQNFLKIVLVFLLLFSFCISYVYATDIDWNLQGENSGQNTLQDENVTGEVQENLSDIPDENPSNVDTTPIENLAPSSVSTVSDSTLGITNIINILLITVGVVIILLAIAIIIRLKK